MPGLDRRGPLSQGPMTGSKAGKCGRKILAQTNDSPESGYNPFARGVCGLRKRFGFFRKLMGLAGQKKQTNNNK